ncbi:hypothetical protein BGZ94_008670 [Podila epigama]|nr:hypothetical protein BGZ94_008670 [Podila epigama]
MAPLGKKSAVQWKFIGKEVNNVNDLTLAHVRSVYGLWEDMTTSTRRGRGIVANPYPYCENLYKDTEKIKKTSKSSTCNASKCKDSPHCLNYLGQSDWERHDAFEIYLDTADIKMDPESRKRISGIPAGMTNLGATCYANSLLQAWFHDLDFRKTIYKCNFDKSEDQTMNALYQLQLLFAFLEHGNQNTYSPSALVESLKLDTSLQQDAQEFCNLFMALIDSQLQLQKSKNLQNFITKQDHCTLMDCFQEFVEAEELTGDDRYSCSKCNSLQEATREIKIGHLPEVLNIQLMRFVYDAITWNKKKSKDMIRFPEMIDFSSLLNSKTPVIYELTAVLVHNGSSAHSGHFLAHVLDKRSQKWFVLNDDEVLEFNSTFFDPESLSTKNTPTKGKKSTKTTLAAPGDDKTKMLDTLSSRNAYMLTYTKKRKTNAKEELTSPPAATMDLVMQDNRSFEKELEGSSTHQESVRETFDRLRQERRQLYQIWDVQDDNAAVQLLEERQISISPILTPDDVCFDCVKTQVQDKLYNIAHRQDLEEFEKKSKMVRSPQAVWISREWLTEWSKMLPKFHPPQGTNVDDPGPNTQPYLSDVQCSHSKLSGDRLKRRLINADSLEVLTSLFGSLDLPGPDAEECEQCAQDLQLEQDGKEISEKALAEKAVLAEVASRSGHHPTIVDDEKYFVVSDAFITQWLEYIKKPLQKERPQSIINDTLLCEHGGFLFDPNIPSDSQRENGYTVINKQEWEQMQALYEGGPPISFSRQEREKSNESDAIFEVSPAVLLDYDDAPLFIHVYSPGATILEEPESERTNGSIVSETGPPPSNRAAVGNNKDGKRKDGPDVRQYNGSRRSKRLKSEKSPFKKHIVYISKNDTVMDLKRKITKVTNIVPIYQKLLYGEKELDRNNMTMMGLEIMPNSVLNVIAFEQTEEDVDLSSLEDVNPPQPGTERGFGGTGLVTDWT